MTTFIFVHGTFVTKANWPALQAGLVEAAGAANDIVQFKQLVWSGKNRAGAREDAAEAILTLVEQIRSSSPNEKIIAVGHSHGGSAIAYFLKKFPEASKALCGCAFLSTPFVAIRPRQEALRAIFMTMFLLAVGAAMCWGHYAASQARVASVRVDSWPPLYLGAAVMILIVLVCRLTLRKKYRSQEDIDELVEQTIRQQTADLPEGEYLFLRCSGDEAAAALSAAQFISWMGSKVFNFYERIFRPLFSKRRMVRNVFAALVPLITGIGLTVSVALLPSVVEVISMLFSGSKLFAGTEHYLSAPLFVALMFIVAFVALVLPLIFFVCLVSATLILAMQAFTFWLFGWTGWVGGFLVELAIEPLPFGRHSLVHIDWNSSSSTATGIVHSWTYAHPASIKCIKDWASLRLGSR
jgi:hypothetical protein